MKTVILAAGFGSRLWPISTSDKPKQFQHLIGDASLLSYTHSIIGETTADNDIYVLGLEGMGPLISEELPNLDAKNIILVPERRNTLPHTLWTLANISENDDDPVLFKSVDHFILNPEKFKKSLKQGLNDYVSNPALTLLCTRFKEYNSNDGYCITDLDGKILNFIEKPDKETLDSLSSGRKVYRSPFIYIASKNSILSALNEVNEQWTENAKKLLADSSENRKDTFLKLPFMDISSKLFQKSHNMRAIEIEYSFIDVGRFQEIYSLNNKDENGNVVKGNVILGSNCRNNLIINNTALPLVVIDRLNSAIIQTSEGSLDSSLSRSSEVGEIYKTKIYKH